MIVIKSTSGKPGDSQEFTVKDGQSVYEINIETGEVIEAQLIPIRDQKLRADVFIIDEKQDGKHVYLPAFTRKGAKKMFNEIAK